MKIGTSVFVLFLIGLCVISISARTAPVDKPVGIEAEVESIRKEFNLPAMAAAVVRTDGHADKAAVGVRVMGKPERVTADDDSPRWAFLILPAIRRR